MTFNWKFYNYDFMHIKRNTGNTVADISTIPFGIYIMHFKELLQRENIFKV